MMKIEIFSDFACPFCYVGKRRLEQAIAELGMKEQVELVYKAYQLNPEADRVEAKLMLSEQELVNSDKLEAVHAHAAEVGLVYKLDKVLVGNTENAHRLAKWAATYGREGAFVEETMHRYFTQGLNVNDAAALLDIVTHVGLPLEEGRAVLTNANAFQEELTADRYDIQQIPVTSVPFFVFENRYGIKGAEPLRIFKETLQQTAHYLEKQKKLKIVGNTDLVCDINGCE